MCGVATVRNLINPEIVFYWLIENQNDLDGDSINTLFATLTPFQTKEASFMRTKMQKKYMVD